MSANFRQAYREQLLQSGFGFYQNNLECDMQNRTVRIDRIHSGAICTEIGDRLRMSLSKGKFDIIPANLKNQLDKLRDIDEESPSIAPFDAAIRPFNDN
jgi:hypothetical protein